MTDTQAEPSLPPDIFSPDDSLNDLWRQAYQGEILGELLFAGIAAQQAPLDPERAAKMRVLAALELRDPAHGRHRWSHPRALRCLCADSRRVSGPSRRRTPAGADFIPERGF